MTDKEKPEAWVTEKLLRERYMLIQSSLKDTAELHRLHAENESLREQNTLVDQACARLEAENEALRKDAERYRWLFSAHTPESLDEFHAQDEPPEPKPQDRVIAYLAGWYCDKATADKIVDAAMKEKP